MPAIASLEELIAVKEQMQSLKEQYPDVYAEITRLIGSNRKIGYRNICKLLLDEATPEKLKAQ